jgi:calnexin
MIPDSDAKQPSDWDNEMDGEWEAPLIANPKCAQSSGCGKWSQPLIDNPKYKGKWRAPLIDNPAFKGKWAPKKIPNPDFYEDLQPFKTLLPIDAGIQRFSICFQIIYSFFFFCIKTSEHLIKI